MRHFLVVLLIAVLAPVASGQQSEDCAGDTLGFSADAVVAQLGSPAAGTTASPSESEFTQAELRVQDIISRDGVHVVHFWAPWCSNSVNELSDGWHRLVDGHPEVTFTFVTVWNDNESGRAMLDRYAVPERVLELTLPDYGPSRDKSQRRRSFLNLPVTWIPTTMIFHHNGELAFSMNYGEMDIDTIDELLDMTQREW